MIDISIPSSIPLELDAIAELAILIMLCITALIVAFSRNLIFSTIAMSAFSLLMALIYIFMNAPDVAMTEAAIGACLTTIFCLVAISNIYNIAENKLATNPTFSLTKIIFVCLVGIALGFIALNIPEYGVASNPIHTHVAPYYIENTGKEIGINSIVAAVLASYRGYDTMGETFVIMTAGIGCLLLLDKGRIAIFDHELNRESDTVLVIISKYMIPLIVLFALYIQIFGEVSPGGGFQAGAILASGLILYSLVFSEKNFLSAYPTNLLKNLAVIGVLIYSLIGVFALISGFSFLDYNFLNKYVENGQYIGIIIIEAGVGITVTSVLLLIYQIMVLRNKNDI